MKTFMIFAFTLILFGCNVEEQDKAFRNVDVGIADTVDCGSVYSENTLVIFTAGQSNAANSVDTVYLPTNNVVTVYNGKCYIGNDPLLGASGTGGSVWTRFADKVIDKGLYDNVMIIATAVGGSASFEWTPFTSNYDYAINQYHMAEDAGIKINMILFHQGESDVLYGTLKDQYIYNINSMIGGMRFNGVDAPIYIAQTSYCMGDESSEIISAQRDIVDMNDNVFSGPNTDMIDPSLRHDGCHFNDEGAKIHADMWIDSIYGK